MPSTRQPGGGETITGPLNMLVPADNSYAAAIDEYGVVAGQTLPYVYYTKPMGATAGTPSTAQVTALCKNLASIVAREIARQSQVLSRVTLLPQQYPSTGYSSQAAVYNYTFGSTAVALTASTRVTASDVAAVDLVLGNPTLTAEMARRLASTLTARIDSDVIGLWSQFTTNAAPGTGGSANPITALGTGLALLTITGEPLYYFCIQSQMGLTNAGVDSVGVVNAGIYELASANSMANGSAPTPSTGGPNVWLIPSPRVATTGSGTITAHNLLIMPSAIGFVFEVETNANNTCSTPNENCLGTANFGNIGVSVWALNSGSGVQTIYASVAYGAGVGINANGVVVKS